MPGLGIGVRPPSFDRINELNEVQFRVNGESSPPAAAPSRMLPESQETKVQHTCGRFPYKQEEKWKDSIYTTLLPFACLKGLSSFSKGPVSRQCHSLHRPSLFAAVLIGRRFSSFKTPAHLDADCHTYI
jgi:hypothetical protein